MQLVVDTNIIIAALFKNSVTRDLLWEESFSFFAPEYIKVELEKLLVKKSPLRKRLPLADIELNELLSLVFRNVTILSEKIYHSFNKQARSLVEHPQDIPFMALALALNIPLWSNDSELKEQSLITVYSTRDLLKIS